MKIRVYYKNRKETKNLCDKVNKEIIDLERISLDLGEPIAKYIFWDVNNHGFELEPKDFMFIEIDANNRFTRTNLTLYNRLKGYFEDQNITFTSF